MSRDLIVLDHLRVCAEQLKQYTLSTVSESISLTINVLEELSESVEKLEKELSNLGGSDSSFGNEITDSWSDLRDKITQGDFTGIHVGDYKTIQLTTGENIVMEVAGVDQYYLTCSSIGHHVDFISRDCMTSTSKMNSTNLNNGSSTVKSPWKNSYLYSLLNDYSGVITRFPSDLASCIIEKRAMVEHRYSASNTSYNTNVVLEDLGKLWLPTEFEVLGYISYSDDTNGYAVSSGCNIQYPIFKDNMIHVLKRNGTEGNLVDWWLMNACRSSNTDFCIIESTGRSYRKPATTEISFPICFRIG